MLQVVVPDEDEALLAADAGILKLFDARRVRRCQGVYDLDLRPILELELGLAGGQASENAVEHLRAQRDGHAQVQLDHGAKEDVMDGIRRSHIVASGAPQKDAEAVIGVAGRFRGYPATGYDSVVEIGDHLRPRVRTKEQQDKAGSKFYRLVTELIVVAARLRCNWSRPAPIGLGRGHGHGGKGPVFRNVLEPVVHRRRRRGVHGAATRGRSSRALLPGRRVEFRESPGERAA